MSAPELIRWTRRVVGGLGLLWVVGLFVVFALRIGFPLELEWMEGGVLLQAHRLQRGESIYPPPSAEFVPFLYTPLYPVVLAGLGTWFPLDFVLGRAVSILAVLLIVLAITRAVRREGKPRSHAALAVGLFASGYVFTFRWLDLVRPDSLAMASTLWGLALLREAWGDHRKGIGAALLLGLAFWTKQTAAVFAVAGLAGALVVAPRQLWSYALTLAVVVGGGVLWLDGVTEGWLWHYIYELHQSHRFNAERFTTKTWGMFLHALPGVALGLVASAVEFLRPWFRPRRRMSPDDRTRRHLAVHRGFLYWGIMAAAGLVVSALGYATQWAEPNAFLPGMILLSVWFGVVVPQKSLLEPAVLGLGGAQLVFAGLVEPRYQPIQTLGLAGLSESYAWQRPEHTIPSARARATAHEVRHRLSSAEGPVFALARPWWSVLAGGPGHAGSMNLHDVDPTSAARIRRSLAERLSTRSFAQVWLEGEPPEWLRPALRGYRVDERRHGDARALPMSGYMSEAGMVTPYREDQLLLVPVSPRTPPPRTRVIADFEDGTLQGFDTEGDAFGRRPTRSITRHMPAIGPHGGEYFLSSGARGLPGTGVALSPAFAIPPGGGMVAWVGASGTRAKLAIQLVDPARSRAVSLPLPPEDHTLREVTWAAPPDWVGRAVRLRVVDQTEGGAVFLDDLWVTESTKKPSGSQSSPDGPERAPMP